MTDENDKDNENDNENDNEPAGTVAQDANHAQTDGGEACHGGERSAASRLPLIRGNPRLDFEEAPRTLGCPRN